MYDSEYFRKVIGENYNPSELYNTTYNSENENKIYSVDTQALSNETIRVDSPVQTNEIIQEVSNNINQNKIYEEFNNAPSTAISSGSNNAQFQNFSNTNVATEQIENVNMVSSNQKNVVRYPEIYYVIQPMTEKVVRENPNMEYTEEVINMMTMEVYNALEVDINPQTANEVNNVINVNARPKNYLLHDLIKIILIEEIEKR